MVKFRATRTYQLHARPPMPEESATATRSCQIPGCRAEGEYRAPVARDRLNEYHWFCLDHVRDYNAAWNFYAGMSEAEIEAFKRADVTWWRPTWPLGGPGLRGRRPGFGTNPFQAENLRDGFGFFHDHGESENPRRHAPPRPPRDEEEALQIMGLPPDSSWAQVKARYKELVKRHHPDANGGDKAAEERLKSINQAYTTLKKTTPSS